MSYEEDRREPYSSPCACGNGVLRYYRIYESNDWDQRRESITPVEILCDFCKVHYYFKHTNNEEGLLIPIQKAKMQSYRPLFKYDTEQDKLDHEKAQKEQNEYREAHKYDPFDARVTYHDSCRVDSTGHYWDSLHILACTDPQYLVLDKPEYGSASITIVKKYKCKCTMCGKELEALSSQFEIKFDVDSNRFYPALQCDCHTVSSFEAKAMDILNSLGVSYKREVMFDELVGDYGEPLRFDFALFGPDSCNDDGNRGIRLLLELQGPHHYKRGEYDEYGNFIEDRENASLSAKARTEKQMRYDGLKRQYCAEHGIALEQIKYTDSSYDKLEERIASVIKQYGFDDAGDDLPF